MRLDRRPVRFHGARTALVDRQDPLPLECCLQSLSPPRFVFCLSDGVSVGVFFPRSPRTRTSDTPVASPSSTRVSSAFAVSSAHPSLLEARELCWCEEAAKTTVTAYS
jgi:hypothetical protein